MNVPKTKYFCVGEETTDWKIENNEIIKKCESYKYLGINFNTEEIDDAEIKSRISKTKNNKFARYSILWSTEIGN